MNRPVLAALALVAAATLTASPASAAATHERFVDVIDETPYDCDGTPAFDSGEVTVVSNVVTKGNSPFPYFREHFSGTATTTNLDTGGTFTNVFSVSSKDHTITDNGDGTITIVAIATGSSRFYDTDGNFVLKDPGSIWTSFTLDYHGTPSNPDDDTEVPGSFEVIKPSTGNSDFSGRDFCEDLRTFAYAPTP